MTGTMPLVLGEPADATLLEAARRADLNAWERVVRRHQEAVYRVAWLIVRDSDLAEAACLSTFVRAYRALSTYDATLDVLPWLIRICAGEARQLRREHGRPTRSSRPVERARAPQFPASAIPGLAQASGLSGHDVQALTEAFDRLGEDDRLVLAARYLLGLSRSDAADALSLSSGALDEHLHGAVRRLRTRVVAA